MKKYFLLALTLIFVFTARSVHASSIIIENFEDYTHNQLLDGASGGDGWDGPWEGSSEFIVTEEGNSSEGDLHVRFQPVVDNFVPIKRSFESTDKVTVYFDVKINRLGGVYDKGVRGDVNLYGDSVHLARVFIRNSGVNNYIESLHWNGLSDEWQKIQEITNDTYYRIGIQLDKQVGNLYRVNVDGGPWSEWGETVGGAAFNGVDTIQLSVSNQDSGAVGEMYFDNIMIQTIAQNSDIFTLLEELISTVDAADFPQHIDQSYMAHLGQLERLFNSANYRVARNQVEAFLHKLEQDWVRGLLDEDVYGDLLERSTVLLEAIPEPIITGVPLITQVESLYPSIGETSSWANEVYAGGRANAPGDCGLTIAQCGCAITSFSMLAKYYGLDKGLDGSSVNPGSMNEWLYANNGYTPDGSVLWTYALAYLGDHKDGKIMSKLTLDGYGLVDDSEISSRVGEGAPAIGFSRAKGHFMVLTGLENDGYQINDPLWYNTKTTDDARDVAGRVQDYNNIIDKAHLFTYHAAPQVLPESIEVVLASPAELLITDSEGRRLGYDPETDMVVAEIPGGVYDREDFIVDQFDPSPNPHKRKRLFLPSPQGDTFELQVIGTGEGAYTVTTAVSTGEGELVSESDTAYVLPGVIKSYTITTEFGSEDLPSYLDGVLSLIPPSEQKKFIQAFRVLVEQDEKDHVIPTKEIIESLIRFVDARFKDELWGSAVIDALQLLLE